MFFLIQKSIFFFKNYRLPDQPASFIQHDQLEDENEDGAAHIGDTSVKL